MGVLKDIVLSRPQMTVHLYPHIYYENQGYWIKENT